MGHPKVRTNDVTPNETKADFAHTVGSSAETLSDAGFTPDVATTHMLWDVQDQPVRFTLDGSTPTASNGHRLVAGDTGVWPVSMAVVATFIREGGTDAVMHWSQMTE